MELLYICIHKLSVCKVVLKSDDAHRMILPALFHTTPDAGREMLDAINGQIFQVCEVYSELFQRTIEEELLRKTSMINPGDTGKQMDEYLTINF